MSDIVIPGVSRNSNIDTTQMIEDLMEVERIPVNRMEDQVGEYEKQQSAWRSLGRTLSSLRDTARSLYGFESPFRERTAESDGESFVTATATRQASEGTTEIEIIQTAGRDRFSSQPLDKDYRVPEGTYSFQVGDDEISLRYSGGTLQDFSDRLNRRGEGVIRTSVIPNTSSTRVLLFESLKAGAENAMVFTDDAMTFALETGILAKSGDRQLEPLDGETVLLQPGEERTFPLSRSFSVESGMKISFEARIVDLEREEVDIPQAPPGPDLPDAGSVTFQGITIRNESAPLGLPEQEVPTPPPVVEDNGVIALRSENRTIPLPEAVPGGTFQKIEVNGRDYATAIDGFQFNNGNTDRTVEIRNVRIYDPAVRGDNVPLNPIETAQDAKIRYSGIEVVRPSNTVDDLISGVTLNLLRPSDDPVSITVQPDRDTVKESIIEFVGYYNQVMRDINIYTRTNEEIIDEIEYFTDDEREKYTDLLGLFQGDSSLNQLKSRLQLIMMNPYPTSDGSAMQLLAQVGISTNASGGGGFNQGRLRGYLEINEEVLDSALETHFPAVTELFGQDTNGDLIMDSGVAVSVEQFSASYVQTGGVISSRTSSLDSRISQTEDRIDRYNVRLDDYEAQLRSEFGRMEGAMQTMQANSHAFDNLGRNNE